MTDFSSLRKRYEERFAEERSPESGGSSPSTQRGFGKYVLGISPNSGKYVTAPADIGTHSLVLGMSGTGKSTFVLSQMLQDVHRGDSVILIDPHGGIEGLSHKFLSHIPRDRWDDVIYINPMTADDYGSLVKINFLESKGIKPDLVRQMFVDALRRAYPRFWGPRLENILTHSLMLLYDTIRDAPTIMELVKVVAGRRSLRWKLLEKCRVQEVTDFWNKDFKDMDKDAYTSVQNKLFKLITASSMRPFVGARESTIDLYDAMNEGEIVVVEIPKGRMTANISRFFGSIFLARVGQLAMQREEIPERERYPVHVYIDEAHTFITEIIQRNMQELRKFGVFLSAASQNLQRYSDVGSENVLPELTDYTIAFRCGEETARRIGEKFSTRLGRKGSEPWKPITKLDDYQFYAAVPISTTIDVRKARTIDSGIGPYDRDEIVEFSLKSHGEKTKKRKAVERMEDVNIGAPHLSPSEFFVLQYLDESEWDRRDNVVNKGKDRFDLPKSEIWDAILNLTQRGCIVKSKYLPGHDNKKAQARNPFVYIPKEGWDALYPELKDPRRGLAEHVSMMCQVARNLREGKKPAFPVLPEDDVPGKPTAKITEVEAPEDAEEVYPDLVVYYDCSPSRWPGSKRAAVEIDAHPEKRSFLKHFRDNRDRIGLPTLFAVKSEDNRRYVRKELEEEGAEIVNSLGARSEPNEVELMVVDPRDIEHPSDVEAERDPDRRLFRQIKESCRGKRRESYLALIGEEEPLEEEIPKLDVPEEEAEKESEVAKIADRVKELGEGNSDRDMEREIRKLVEEGCEFNILKDGEVEAEWKESDEKKSASLGRIGEELKSVTKGKKPSTPADKEEERTEPKSEEGVASEEKEEIKSEAEEGKKKEPGKEGESQSKKGKREKLDLDWKSRKSIFGEEIQKLREQRKKSPRRIAETLNELKKVNCNFGLRERRGKARLALSIYGEGNSKRREVKLTSQIQKALKITEIEL